MTEAQQIAVADDVNGKTLVAYLAEALSQLRDAELALRHDSQLKPFYQRVLYDLMLLVEARYAALGLFDQEGRVEDFLTLGISEAVSHRIGRTPEGKGVLAAFYHAGKTVRIDDIAEHPSSVGFPPGHPPMKSLMGGPVAVDGRIRGVIYLADRHGGEPFAEADETVLNLFITEVQHVLERNDLFARLRQEQEGLKQQRREQEALIEKLQEARDQLLQSEKLASLGQLAAGVAHEINNPIGYINSNLGSLGTYVNDLIGMVEVYQVAEDALEAHPDLLRFVRGTREKLDLEYVKQDIRDLVRESQEGIDRVKKIVQDLKDFSRTGAAEWEWADLHKGIDSTLNIVWNEIKYKAEVIRHYGPLPPVQCIPSQLNQVFMNLLVNAAHAIETRGIITIHTFVEDGWVRVRIGDTGCGMSQEVMDRIFDPFFTTKPVGKGTGLGLSLAFGIVERHGGRIRVRSWPGEGSIFTVELPVKQPEGSD